MFWQKFLRSTKSLRGQFTLLYTLLLGFFLAIFAYLITGLYLQEERVEFDDALLNYGIDFSTHLEALPYQDLSEVDLPRFHYEKHFPFKLAETSFQIRKISGETLHRSKPEAFRFTDIPYSPIAALSKGYTHRLHSFTVDGVLFRGINIKVPRQKGDEIILQLATFDHPMETKRSRILWSVYSILFIVLSFALVTSYFVAGNALKPISEMSQKMNQIAADNLSARLPIPQTDDEIHRLATSFNTLLERLEKAFTAYSQFVGNASHQLNTPLTILRSELAVMKDKVSTPEKKAQVESLSEEVERLIELVKNLLLIARVESGQEHFHFQNLRVDEILMGTIGRLHQRAKEKNIQLKMIYAESVHDDEEKLIMRGEKQLIECLFENLIENAIKYSPPEGIVEVKLSWDKNLLVTIQDQGPGISDELWERLHTIRFTRGGLHLPGTGIGLAIAFEVARHHHIKMEKLNTEKGLCLQCRFN